MESHVLKNYLHKKVSIYSERQSLACHCLKITAFFHFPNVAACFTLFVLASGASAVLSSPLVFVNDLI